MTQYTDTIHVWQLYVFHKKVLHYTIKLLYYRYYCYTYRTPHSSTKTLYFQFTILNTIAILTELPNLVQRGMHTGR